MRNCVGLVRSSESFVRVQNVLAVFFLDAKAAQLRDWSGLGPVLGVRGGRGRVGSTPPRTLLDPTRAWLPSRETVQHANSLPH